MVEMTDSPSTTSKELAFKIPPTPFFKGGVRRRTSNVSPPPLEKGAGGILFHSRTAQRTVTDF